MLRLSESEKEKLSLVLSRDQVAEVERAAEAHAAKPDEYQRRLEELEDVLVRELGAVRVCDLIGHEWDTSVFLAPSESEPGYRLEHCRRCGAAYEAALVLRPPPKSARLAAGESEAVRWLLTEARACLRLARIGISVYPPEKTTDWLRKAAEKMEKANLVLEGELPGEVPELVPGTFP